MADDFIWMAGGDRAILNLVALVYVYVLVGAPFSWKKCAGGYGVSRVGFFLDAERMEFGLSLKRTEWLRRWC